MILVDYNVYLNTGIVARCYNLIDYYGTLNVIKHHLGHTTFTHQAPTTKCMKSQDKSICMSSFLNFFQTFSKSDIM